MSAKYYELRYMFKKNCTSSKLMHLLYTASKWTLFSVSGFKHLSEMSSKTILIISSYTISKLVHFLRHSVH